MTRKIIHVDMDAFYASIEQRDNPEFRNKPLAVGYSGKRGVVAAASYEARRYGIHSAMASVTALRKCPHLIFVMPRFDVYKSVSSQINQIFLEYTDLVEPLSLDEAFLDVSTNRKGIRSATIIAKEIKQKIYNHTHLTASAGVSYNKFLAKIASDYKKPNGLFVITPDMAESFVEELPIERFFGVGKVTAAQMNEMGIHNGRDLKKCSEDDLVKHFGRAGSSYYNFARGIDDREVESERIRKSLGSEVTFMDDLYEIVDLFRALDDIAQEVYSRVSKKGFYGKTLTLKVKYADFTVITRSKTVTYNIKTYEQIFDLGKELLILVDDLQEKKVRLMGLTIKNSDNESEPDSNKPIQLQLDFTD